MDKHNWFTLSFDHILYRNAVGTELLRLSGRCGRN
jgi:hypothetical protein